MNDLSQKWDYPAMSTCASKLDKLSEESIANKGEMDKAIELLTAGVQAETGKAFIAAYSEHVSSIQLFAEILKDEAELLRTNSNTMQAEDERIAAEVRAKFGL